MPLEHGKSKKAFIHNVKTEIDANPGPKHRAQNLAIAYAIKRRAQKKACGGYADGGMTEGMDAEMMAEGGMLTKDGYQSSCNEHCNHPGVPHPQASGFVEHEGDHKRPNHMAIEEDDRMLNQHGEDEEGPKGNHPGKEDGFYAVGGRIEPMQNEQGPEYEEDMVGRIMKKRQMMYSEGGKVANDDHPFEYEFEEPNQYDDLVKRDDLDFSYTGANSGDEDGNEYDANHNDVVSRIMMKRKKQHNPRPA